MKQISILGCGWLGLPLAEALLWEKFAVNGSTTSETKLLGLKNLGISPFLIALNENEITGNIDGFLENSEILIIDIPPKLRSEIQESFISKIEVLIPFIEKSNVEKVIFVSSTSVYQDSDLMIDENTIAFPETESGKQLLIVENLLLANKNFETTIIRFGGLIGNDRNPIKFLAGKKEIENPNAPINFIHQTDCIGIIIKIIELNVWNEIFNGVAPFHPTRKEYYCKKALEFGLVLPEFNESKPTIGKTILSEKVERVLGYTFLGEI